MSAINSQEKSDEETRSDRREEHSSERQAGEWGGRESEEVTFAGDVPPEPERYAIGSTETVKHGFSKEFCDFTRKKGMVDDAMLIAEFAGRQIHAHKIDAARVHRYIRCAINNGQFKPVKKAGGQPSRPQPLVLKSREM
jgi:hypothetical protein